MERPDLIPISLGDYWRLTTKTALKDFAWGRDLSISTAIALLGAFVQVWGKMIPLHDRRVFVLSIVAPYVLFLGIHLALRFARAPWKVHQEREMELKKAIIEVEDELDAEKAKERSPKLFLEYSSMIASSNVDVHSGLVLKNAGETAFNIKLEAEVVSGLTLQFENPPQNLEKDHDWAIGVRAGTIEFDRHIFRPFGGVLSVQISSFFERLAKQSDECSITVTITSRSYDRWLVERKARIRMDSFTGRIWCELV